MRALLKILRLISIDAIHYCFRKDIFRAPPSLESVVDCFDFDSGFSRPITHGLSFSIMGDHPEVRLSRCGYSLINGPPALNAFGGNSSFYNSKLNSFNRNAFSITIKNIVSPVHGLLVSGGPLAIFFSVIPIWINAVNSTIRRAFPHIGEEVFKLIPSWIDRDTTSAIVGVFVIVRIKASVFHVDPRGVCLAGPFPTGVPVNRCNPSTGLAYFLRNRFPKPRSIPSRYCSALPALLTGVFITVISKLHHQLDLTCRALGLDGEKWFPAFSKSLVHRKSIDELDWCVGGLHGPMVGFTK